MQTAVVCPKCSYARQPSDGAPAWQCPSCGIAYVKYSVKQLVAPPRSGDAAPPLALDGSIWLLLAVNVAALGVAYWQKWPPTQLMLVYWAQSIAIGMSYVLRILALEKFTTEGLRILGEPVEATPEMRPLIAILFVFSFGFVHAIYLVFLVAGASMIAKTPLRFDLWFFACVLAFALNHYWSYRYNRELDRQGTPNAGTLMVTPFARVVPMHLMAVSGALAFSGAGLLLFGVLKIGVDVGMHLHEHAQLQKIRKGEA